MISVYIYRIDMSISMRYRGSRVWFYFTFNRNIFGKKKNERKNNNNNNDDDVREWRLLFLTTRVHVSFVHGNVQNYG